MFFSEDVDVVRPNTFFWYALFIFTKGFSINFDHALRSPSTMYLQHVNCCSPDAEKKATIYCGNVPNIFFHWPLSTFFVNALNKKFWMKCPVMQHPFAPSRQSRWHCFLNLWSGNSYQFYFWYFQHQLYMNYLNLSRHWFWNSPVLFHY